MNQRPRFLFFVAELSTFRFRRQVVNFKLISLVGESLETNQIIFGVIFLASSSWYY